MLFFKSSWGPGLPQMPQTKFRKSQYDPYSHASAGIKPKNSKLLNSSQTYFLKKKPDFHIFRCKSFQDNLRAFSLKTFAHLKFCLFYFIKLYFQIPQFFASSNMNSGHVFTVLFKYTTIMILPIEYWRFNIFYLAFFLL